MSKNTLCLNGLQMKLWVLILLSSLTVRAQESKEITFRIHTNNIPDTENVYITGNGPELGNWQPDRISLINTSGNLWEKSISLPAGEHVEFKITRGSWDTEEVMSDGTIPGNHKLFITEDTTINLIIQNWKDHFKNKLKGQVTGKVDYYRSINGKGILPRDIIVWLPPGYDTETDQKYSVFYMQDGQNLFDPATSAFSIDWQMDETADSLIRDEMIDPVIIVGLANTKWRSSEYADNDTGHAYMDFIVTKVKPFIDSVYRTLKGPEYTAVGGSSLGALISFMLGWNYPGIFSKVMCISPALKYKYIDYVDDVEKYNGIRKNLKFYFDWGGNSLDSLLAPGTKEMINALEEKGFREGKDILWYEDKEGLHNEASWARRIWRPLKFFYGKKD